MMAISNHPKHSRVIIAALGLSVSTYYYRPHVRSAMTEARGRKAHRPYANKRRSRSREQRGAGCC